MDHTEKLLSGALELRQLWGIHEIPEILVMGPVNAGKSTLINRLLGSDVCPVDASPSTLLPIRLMAGDEYAAQVCVKGKLKTIISNKQLSDLVRKKTPLKGAERIDLNLSSGLLNWCTLVDTPGVGFSPENDRLLESLISRRPGMIIFLLHQRGLDAAAHRFLAGVCNIILNRNIEISFWINSNTGYSDGTPLPETRTALRELFPGRGPAHLTNTRDPKSVEVLSLYIKSRLAEQSLRSLEKQLRENDRALPGKINKTARVKSDEEFLLKYWDLVGEARSILLGREMITRLPMAAGEINSLLSRNTARLTRLIENTPASSRAKEDTGTNSRDLREIMARITADKKLYPYIIPGRLEEIADMVREKGCTVAAVGPFSSGKTTFFNALLGEAILPAEDRATTSCPVILQHGPEKRAAVNRLQQAEFYPVEKKGEKYRLAKEELAALHGLVTDPGIISRVADAEILQENRWVRVTREKLPVLLTDTINYFARAGESQRNIINIPLISRLLSKNAVNDDPPVTAVRINFKNACRDLFNLSDPAERENFYKTISPPYSFLAEQVELFHPAPVLRTVTFMDTPGVDSLHGRHRRQALKCLGRADILLLFLHGKQVLTEGLTDWGGILEPETIPAHIFYVINFADTLSQLEREKVSLFVRQKMPLRMGKSPIPYPGVYLISSLEALQGRNEGFTRLIRQLGRTAEDINLQQQMAALEKLKELLQEVSKKASGYRDGRENRAAGPGAAQEYLRELSRVEKLLTVPGGLAKWKTPDF